MSDQQQLEYISSDVFFELAQNEYMAEMERANRLDNKASFFITVVIAVCTIFIPIIPFNKLLSAYKLGTCIKKLLMIHMALAIVLAFILLFIAIKQFYAAYKLTEYKRANLDSIDLENNLLASKDKVYKGLCDHYKTIVTDNINTNNNKAKSIRKGIITSGIGILILIISTIGLIIIIGGV